MGGGGVLVFVHRIIKKMKPATAMALIIAAVSGTVLIMYKWVNPDRQAERHFLEHDNQVAYKVMEACYIVILVAAAFNFRYLLFDLGSEVMSSVMPTVVASKSSKAYKALTASRLPR